MVFNITPLQLLAHEGGMLAMREPTLGRLRAPEVDAA
jgi:hypothetical protein